MKKFGFSIFRTEYFLGKVRSHYCQGTRNQFFNFSTLKSDKNPNQIPDEVKKMIQSQKIKTKSQQLPIIKDISQLKSAEQLPQIYKKLAFMSKQNRQIALRYLLSGIYQNKLPFQVIEQKPLQVNLKQFQHLRLQTQIFQINYQVHKIQQIKAYLSQSSENAPDKEEKQKKILQLQNKINDMYYKAFNQTLKGISKDHIMKSKATLYKHFAEYNFQYLFDPQISDKKSSLFDSNMSTLKKARQFLIESLQCHKRILLNEHKKLQSDEMMSLKEQNGQRHQIRLNAIKQNIRKIVQSIGQCLYAVFKVLNKQNRMLKDNLEHKNRKIELLSLIQVYIPFYSIIPGIKQLSMMYYKLYKIKIEAKFTSVNEPKTPDEVKAKIKQTVEQYSRLYRQCQDCLDQSIKTDSFAKIKEISTTMISIKYMIGRNIRKSEVQLKNSLAEEARNIIQKMKKQLKQPIQQTLLHFIKQLIEVKN